MRKTVFFILCFSFLSSWMLPAQEEIPEPAAKKSKSPGRLSLATPKQEVSAEPTFVVPLPAHAAKTVPHSSAPTFQPPSNRKSTPALAEEPPAQAEYLLPDRNEKPPITPEISNLNLPADLEITAQDTGEKIVLPAGTYRQILQLPIDSPLMQTTDQVRRTQSQPTEVKKAESRYAEPDKKPVWVRFESLEKIKIGEAERRGGIDLPSHGPKELGPRVWYAKSESADLASSVFYFVFGGLGYSTANILGWSAGNTREIPGDFEYRLIRR